MSDLKVKHEQFDQIGAQKVAFNTPIWKKKSLPSAQSKDKPYPKQSWFHT